MFFDIFKKESVKQEESELTAEEVFEQGKACEAQDKEKAFDFFVKAAEMGCPAAMHKVGQSYLYRHKGAPFDLKKSAYWYEKAANKNQIGSMVMLSQCYMAGAGVPESDVIAKVWLERALEQAITRGDERAAEIAKRRLNDLEGTKKSMKALYAVAIEMGGIPPQK